MDRGGPETAGLGGPLRVSSEPLGALKRRSRGLMAGRRGDEGNVSCAIMRSSEPEAGVGLAYALASRQGWSADASE